jgi:hypothetical protein
MMVYVTLPRMCELSPSATFAQIKGVDFPNSLPNFTSWETAGQMSSI